MKPSEKPGAVQPAAHLHLHIDRRENVVETYILQLSELSGQIILTKRGRS